MADNKFKRHIAYKVRVNDLETGKPVMDGERFSFIELGDKKISRVNLAGNIVEKYESEGETKYVFFTFDDGSGQIQLRVFGDDLEKFKGVEQGQTVVVIGLLRQWNDKLYITPEIIKEKEPKYLLLRKLEIEKQREKESDPIERGQEQKTAVKDKILREIKNAEEEGGIEIDKIIMNLREVSPTIIRQEIEKFVSEGIVFEPSPGKVRYLG